LHVEEVWLIGLDGKRLRDCLAGLIESLHRKVDFRLL
jgi:hypothetical protein